MSQDTNVWHPNRDRYQQLSKFLENQGELTFSKGEVEIICRKFMMTADDLAAFVKIEQDRRQPQFVTPETKNNYHG